MFAKYTKQKKKKKEDIYKWLNRQVNTCRWKNFILQLSTNQTSKQEITKDRKYLNIMISELVQLKCI